MSSRWLERQHRLEEEEAAATRAAAVVAAIEVPTDAPEPSAEASAPSKTYTWVTGDDLWKVATRLNLAPLDLLEHNDISDWRTIKPGDVLHLPYARDVTPERSIRVKVTPKLEMHVSKPGGCHKWAFADMKAWDDAKGSGYFPENTNITIVGVAYVPITEDDGAETEAAYYLDAYALGDYETTGRLRWSVGFSWSDLAEGHVERPRPMPAVVRQQQQQPTKTLDGFSRPFVEKRIDDATTVGIHDYKKTYQALPEPDEVTAFIPDDMGEADPETGTRFIWVHEFDTRRPDKKLVHQWEGKIAGTFEYDGVIYARPLGAAKAGLWYGIDTSLLQANSELYNTVKLAWSERLWQQVARLAHSPRLKRFRRKVTNNKGQ